MKKSTKKTKKNTGWGGPRSGAGRRAEGAEPKEYKTIGMQPETWEAVEKYATVQRVKLPVAVESLVRDALERVGG